MINFFFFRQIDMSSTQFYSSFKKEKRNLEFHGIFTFIGFTEWSDDLHLWVNVGGHCGHFPLPYNLQLKTVFLSHANHFNHVYICSDYEIKDDGEGGKNATVFVFGQICPHCENYLTSLSSYFQVLSDLIRNLQRTFKEKRLY